MQLQTTTEIHSETEPDTENELIYRKELWNVDWFHATILRRMCKQHRRGLVPKRQRMKATRWIKFKQIQSFPDREPKSRNLPIEKSNNLEIQM